MTTLFGFVAVFLFLTRREVGRARLIGGPFTRREHAVINCPFGPVDQRASTPRYVNPDAFTPTPGQPPERSSTVGDVAAHPITPGNAYGSSDSRS